MTRILFALLLPGAPEHLLGDLEEETASHNMFWLFRHTLTAAFHRAQLLESAAATAFLLAIPLLLTLELRRYALTLIPYRESAALTAASLTALFAMVAILAALQTIALKRRPLAVFLAGITTASIAHLTQTPQLLTVAALCGGFLATRKLTRKQL